MRQWIRLILIGLCVAFIASSLARMLQPEQSPKARVDAVDVVVAARDIDIGNVLVAEDLATERVADGPKARSGVPLAAAAVGRTASSVIRKGQLVREDDLAAPGAGASLASLVQPGQRAVTVALRDPGPGPALYPGAFVDVLVTADIPSKASGFREAMTRTVIERSRVLAVNDLGIGGKAASTAEARDRRSVARNPTITLLVTPEQANQLELASVRGTVGIALCAAGDDTGAPAASGVTTSGLLGITIEPDAPRAPVPEPVVPVQREAEKPEPEAPAEPPAAKVWEVVVVRGDNTIKHGFPVKSTPQSEPSSPPSAEPRP
jgi:pilus assembly protein CpaB